MSRRFGLPWWAWVFGVALALRFGWLFLAHEPLVYQHQQRYLQGALAILENENPVRFVLTSDEWRRWTGTWTIAPLYYVFAASVFGLFGPHLLPLQILQCLMDAGVAVGVGAMGRRLGAPSGLWGGLAYAVFWPAVQIPSGTLTENLHTPLLVLAFVLMLRAEGVSAWALAGVALGVSSLARSVGSAFVPLAVLVLVATRGLRGGLRPALAFVAGACAVLLPWAARNAFVVGDPVLVDSMGVYNLWEDNAFRDGHAVSPDARTMPSWVFVDRIPESERRARANAEVIAGVTGYPGLFLGKVRSNLAHFLRPDMLHQLLIVEFPDTALRYVLAIVFDDLLLLAVVPLFLVFLVAGRRTPAWALVAAWTAYYLLMVVVVFHNEIRYRTALVPLALAGAAAGLALLREPGATSRLARLALALGLLVSGAALWPSLRAAVPVLRAEWVLRGIDARLAAGDVAGARGVAKQAAAIAPYRARPWLRLGRALAWSNRPGPAAEAYGRAASVRRDNWVPTLVLPQLLWDAGELEPGARVATKRAADFSRAVDPWLALEIPWRELPAPECDAIDVGRRDYGAVRDFYGPKDGGRWTRDTARLRLSPLEEAPAYDITLVMGSPEPSPYATPEVAVRTNAGAAARFHLQRDMASYTFRSIAPRGRVLEVVLSSPTWTRRDAPAEQGVRVERMTVAAAR